MGASFTRAFRIGEGPEYRPFRDLRSMPEAGRPREQVENRGKGLYSGPSPTESRAGIFSLFRNSERLAENRFLKAGKAAENTKEKSRQCFTYHLLGLPERVKSKHYIPPPF